MGGFRAQREKMWRYDPHCHWCKCLTVLPLANGKSPRAPNEATIDHLRPRHDPTRSEPSKGWQHKDFRRVLACWACNNKRDQLQSALLPKDWFYSHGGSLPATMKPIEELRRIEETILKNLPRLKRRQKGRAEKNLREIRAAITARLNDAQEQTVKQEHGPLPAEAGGTQETRESGTRQGTCAA